MYFTHVLQEDVLNVSSVFNLMLHSYCKCLCCSAGGEPGPADGARGVPGGRRMGALGSGGRRCWGRQTGLLQVGAHWGRARPQPRIPALVCRPRGESERDERVKGRAGGYRDGGWAKADVGGLRGCPDARASVRTSGR